MTADQLLSQAVGAAKGGDFAQAERLCRSLPDASPRHYWGWVVLGDVLVRSRRVAEALAAYDTAIGIDPGYGGPFSRAAIIRFRMAFGQPPRSPSPSRPSSARVQMTLLGSYGRFGNQLLQYAFVRLHAEVHDLVAEFPDWIGRDLFALDDPYPSASLPGVDEKDFDVSDALSPTGRTLAEHDVAGFFCGSTAAWGDRAARFRALYRPGEKLRPLLDRAWGVLEHAGRTVVAIHLRHGDFGYGRYWVAPAEWYLAWLREIWPRLEDPVLYVATDDVTVLSRFAEFSPWDASRLGVQIPGADFMVDHHVLRNADHVAIANSTFSFTAAMLNERALTFMRPHPDRRELVSFEPWASRVLLLPVFESGETTTADRAVLKRYFRADDSVVHIGRHCSPWTHLARSILPRTRIHELEEGASIDRFRREQHGAQITHLVVESPQSLSSVVAAAADTLSQSGIDMLHVRVPSAGIVAILPRELKQLGYELFVALDGSLTPADDGAPLRAGYYIAMQNRVLKARAGP